MNADPVIAFSHCFQSLGNHWLRYPLRAPSWADENVPESLSYQWGRRPLLPGRKDSAVRCSRLVHTNCPCFSLPFPLLPLLPYPSSVPSIPPSQTRWEWSGVALEWGEGESCKYSEATLKVFVTPDGGPAWRIQLWIGKWASAISAA